MHLRNLQFVNFKNYEEAEISLSDRLNCFVGKNGSGKTNILDAVYYLSMCKSYLNTVDRQNIRFGESFFVITGDWEKDENHSKIHCAVKLGAKKVFKKNKKEYEKLAEHIGQFPVVMISPYDRDLISEGSELRRKWMDSIISQFNRAYLEDIQLYTKVLAQRNALLKNMAEHQLFDRESIEVWNDQLASYGERIYQVRKQFIEEFIPVFQKHYNEIGFESEDVHVNYRSQLHDSSFDQLFTMFERKDAITRYTNGGIHKDDLVFEIKNHPIKKFGSQGQQKSFIIALRLAQYEWLKSHLRITPVLLLDDIFDKLDQQRVEKLVQLVHDNFFGQVFITDTDLDRVTSTLENGGLEAKIFEVDNNTVQELNPIEAL